MQTQIRFLVGGANSLVGGFCAGDRARVSAEMAKHLVEIGVAKHDQPAEVEKPAEKPAKAKKK